MSSKSRSSGGDLDDIISEQPKTFNSAQLTYFAVIAFFLSALPAYLFWTVFDFAVSDYWLVYLGVTAVSTACLTLAYRNVARSTYASLSNARFSVRKSKRSAEQNEFREDLLVSQAQHWSLFFNNAIFVLCYLFLSFYVLRSVPIAYNYTVAIGVSAALVWQLS
jgi:hypothetical protein